MWKKLGLALLLKSVEAFQAYAATTADPLDDVIGAAVKGLLEKLAQATSKAEVVAACEHAKATVEAL